MPSSCWTCVNRTTIDVRAVAAWPAYPEVHLKPHPDTLDVIRNRHTKRGQLNHAVPEILQLQRRIRRCNADTGVPHGDIVALALDIWLRAKGYPPELKPRETETF